MVCSIIKQLPFEVLQNAVREKPEKNRGIDTSESSLVACFGVFWNGHFREFWYWAGGIFQFLNGIPGGPVCGSGIVIEVRK